MILAVKNLGKSLHTSFFGAWIYWLSSLYASSAPQIQMEEEGILNEKTPNWSRLV